MSKDYLAAEHGEDGGLTARESEQVKTIIDAWMKDHGFMAMLYSVNQTASLVSAIDLKIASIHKVLLGNGTANDSVVMKLHSVILAEAARAVLDSEGRWFKRQVSVGVLVAVLLSLGTLLWNIR